MLSVQAIYESAPSVIGQSVLVEGLLLGTGFEHQYIADSTEGYDRGIALPILGGSLFELLGDSGVGAIGGGRFSFWYNAVIQAEVVLADKRGHKYGLTNITSLIVSYRNKQFSVIPAVREV